MEPITQNALKIDIRGTQGNYFGTWFSNEIISRQQSFEPH